MSVKKHTQKEIGAFLKEQIPALAFVDKYRGQLDTPGIFTFPRPAVFISFGRFEWESMVNGSQRGEGLIKFRIVVENYADSYEGSVNQELALDFFEFNEKVHETLQGLSGTYFSNLDRKTDEDDEDHGNVIVTIMEYQTTLIDNSANEIKNYVLVDPALNVEYKNKQEFPTTLPETPVFIIPMD
ncbi:hypothetical protein [Flavobacterium maritimum]|uniref:hypothetical protein n=1 Tax=Flavobacterium maritimum TaxID=3149042 RepID=UPI0032B3E7B8